MMRLLVCKAVLTFVLFYQALSDCMTQEELKNSKQFIYIKGVQCNVSKKIVFMNYSCFAKSHSRTCSTVNIIGTTIKPLMNLHVSLSQSNSANCQEKQLEEIYDFL